LKTIVSIIYRGDTSVSQPDSEVKRILVYADSWPYSTLGEPVGNYEAVTAKAGEAITKGQLVKITAANVPPDGPTVSVCGADEVAYGVAMQDIANGAIGKVLTRGRVKVRAGGAITLGTYVKPGASGRAVAGLIGTKVGIAESAAAADGDDLLISFGGF